ncbi:MAG: hypothetical protein LIO44_01685, partial [Eubacterium sp.]|nr:hypothetical protein [Eubacterium sp.]
LIAGFAAAFVKLKDTYGLYIKDGSLYYKTFRYKVVNPMDITAIKILKEQIHNFSYPGRRHSSEGDDKSSNENCLYRAFYLSKVNDKIKKFKGEEKGFISRFGENIMFVTVYDEDAVKKIMEMNPNIQLIN